MFLQKEYICDQENINNNFCEANQTGQFILEKNATRLSNNVIFTKAIHLSDPGEPVQYTVAKTGYYCVGTTGFSPDGVLYKAVAEFRNAYGELPAAQIAKLPFYGGITIVYAVIGVYVKKLLYVDLADQDLAFGPFSMFNIDMTSVSFRNSDILTFS